MRKRTKDFPAKPLPRQRSYQVEPRAYRVNDFCEAYGIGRTKLYELINDGVIRTVLVGGRRLIPADAAEALLNSEAA